MTCRQAHFTSRAVNKRFTRCIIACAFTFVFLGTANAKCPITLTEALGPKIVHQIQTRIEEAERKFRAAKKAVPQALATTASETLPLLRRVDLLNPVRPKPRIYVDAYYGQNLIASPDVHVLPKDERTLCLLQPGRAVFLSDGATHHYALVYSIDYRKKTVTLLDPWASVSFLLNGHNLIGVSAIPRLGRHGEPLLDISFDGFLRALHGSIEEFLPSATFVGIEAFYPAMANTEDYLFWKYSRLMATNSFQMSFFPVVELTSRKDFDKMPKLTLLSKWADDYLIGVISGFSVPAPGMAANKSDIPKLRRAFLARLPAYAKVLPWTLKWLLLQRTKEIDDIALRLAILDAYLKEDPHDTDFQIARAEVLLRKQDPSGALEQLERAGTQWINDVSNFIALRPAAKGIAFLFARDYGLQSLAVLHWRYVRVQLLTDIAQLEMKSGRVPDLRTFLEGLQRKYIIGSVLIDFFPDVMWAASLSGDEAAEETYIRTIARVKDDPDRLEHLGLALYNQFVSRQSITALANNTARTLAHSSVGHALCDVQAIGRFVPAMKKAYVSDLDHFCRGAAHLARPRETNHLPETVLIRAALKWGASSSRVNAYCGSIFAFSVDREH